MVVEDGVRAARRWIGRVAVADPRLDQLVTQLTALAVHAKWEVRREVAASAESCRHPGFQVALARLVSDDHHQVRNAAIRAIQRRRDWTHSSSLEQERANQVAGYLADVEARFGVGARAATLRASEGIANMYIRELNHEITRIIAPLASALNRLESTVNNHPRERPDIEADFQLMRQRTERLVATLSAMRAFTSSPRLVFRAERVQSLFDEVVQMIRDRQPQGPAPEFAIHGATDLVVDVDRSRFIQALGNVVANAIESYDTPSAKPVCLCASVQDNVRLVISVSDRGYGMSDEAMADARKLYSTSKSYGTGFGLPLAIKIVEFEHYGALDIDSKKDVGTTVRLTLPLRREEVTDD